MLIAIRVDVRDVIESIESHEEKAELHDGGLKIGDVEYTKEEFDQQFTLIKDVARVSEESVRKFIDTRVREWLGTNLD